MKCLNCENDFQIKERQTVYCSRECMRDYSLQRAIFANKYSKEIKAYNMEFSEKMEQLRANEWFLGGY